MLRACKSRAATARGWSTGGPFLRGYLTSDSGTTCLHHEQLGREEGGNQPRNLNPEKLWCLPKPCFHTFQHKGEFEKVLPLQLYKRFCLTIWLSETELFWEKNQQKWLSSESKSHHSVGLQIEMHHHSAFEGDFLVTCTYIPVLNPVTNLTQFPALVACFVHNVFLQEIGVNWSFFPSPQNPIVS